MSNSTRFSRTKQKRIKPRRKNATREERARQKYNELTLEAEAKGISESADIRHYNDLITVAETAKMLGLDPLALLFSFFDEYPDIGSPSWSLNVEIDCLQLVRPHILEASQGHCFYCGAQMDKSTRVKSSGIGNEFSIDHVIPESRGGSSAPTNLVACCRSCNSRKGVRTLEEYRAYVSKDPNFRFWGENQGRYP